MAAKSLFIYKMLVERKILPNHILLGQTSTLIREGEDVTLRVKGRSMMPFIHGDRDSVVLTRALSVSVGDIVLCEFRPGKYVLHRVIEVRDCSLTLMGDGNYVEVEECDISSVRGVVVRFTRNGLSIDCSSKRYRRLSRLWVQLRPIRRILLGVYKLFI